MRRSLCIGLSLIAACGGEAEDLPNPSAEARLITAVPQRATAAPSSLQLDGAVLSLGADAEGHLTLLAGGAVFSLIGAELIERSLYAAPGDPAALGSVHAIAQRSGGGAWIAADAGLFRLEPPYVSYVPIDIGGGPARAVADVAQGAVRGLWIASSAGLFHRAPDGTFERLEIGGMGIDVTGFAAEPGGAAALARDASGLLLIEAEGGKLFASRPALAAGPAHAVAASAGTLWAAADGGLFRWRAGDQPRWTRFTFSSDPASAIPAVAVAVDPATGAAWARTAADLIRVEAGDALSAFAAPGGTQMGALAVDGIGDVWTAGGSELHKLSTGSGTLGVTFEADLKPWLAMHCALCHQNATADFLQYEVFAERAETALGKVRAGDMPRCDGAQVCPQERRLQPADYAVLESWIREGKPR
jgi:ligand-binding sensor domain-containing protein